MGSHTLDSVMPLAKQGPAAVTVVCQKARRLLPQRLTPYVLVEEWTRGHEVLF